jgi:hypothetical protein
MLSKPIGPWRPQLNFYLEPSLSLLTGREIGRCIGLLHALPLVAAIGVSEAESISNPRLTITQ